ncbi:glycosyltransferase family A protein [Pectobacterium carotovorum subsp. carotovorum]|uniref:glycosyltransferase family A protein n=1 Tax=Pectobacterium carotovorum TaxID=554 RepID=UPI0023658AE4|nr:glycosyltransferase family A protein [Pectobacterium carotovorum]WDG00264.1 glycosyltransferase family A protein [Pectobacterium carotovorum subsp. carotovorum]
MNIELLLSTMNDGIENIKINHDFDYLIIHQVTNGREGEYNEFFNKNISSEKIRYIQMNRKGLSLSRNVALKNSVGSFLWVMDDDVVIHDDALERIKNLIENNASIDVFILNHSDDMNAKIAVKKAKKHNFFSAAKISSIDILINRRLIENGLLFNEEFGLGTSLPSGEEYIFITDALKKNFCVLQTNLIVSYHPPFSSGLDFFSSENKIAAKVEMFKRIFGFKGRLLTFAFFIKKLPEYAFSGNFKKVLKIVLRQALFKYP